jgi:hypothetical protein
MKIVAIVLIVIGLIGLLAGGISFTTKEKVIDLGPIDVTRDKTHTAYIPLAASIAALVAGGLMLTVGQKRT